MNRAAVAKANAALVAASARLQRTVNAIAAHPHGRPFAELFCARMAAALELPTRSAQGNALGLLLQEIVEAVDAFEGAGKKETLH